jgi:spore maturation protein CgeB
MDKMVIPGKQVAVYDDLDDCVSQAKYYLDNPAERETIAGAGYLHVRARHTYDDVVGQIIDKYDELVRQNG